MFNLNSCIEVFGVQVEPQPSVLFAAVNKAVEPLCQLTFSDLNYNDISCLVPSWCRLWGWLSHASWDRQLGVNLVQGLCGIRLGTFPLRWSIRDTNWSRAICLFHGLLLASCIGAEWVTFSWRAKLHMNSLWIADLWWLGREYLWHRRRSVSLGAWGSASVLSYRLKSFSAGVCKMVWLLAGRHTSSPAGQLEGELRARPQFLLIRAPTEDW